ncbi:hypothetical protein [Luteolibacter sp. LG18]|uniref:hypothetical protein n=1 Tax=Luteolibacter sp. LG18 TaxID=2819286 RepID=UPI0030C6F994
MIALGLLVLACREEPARGLPGVNLNLGEVGDGLKTIGYSVLGAVVVLALAGLARSSRY